MRYKSLPMSVRSGRPDDAAPATPPQRRPRSRIRDWLITLPMIMLLPALAIPVITAGAASSPLEIVGQPVAGTRIKLVGHDLPANTKLLFLWDGVPTKWLDGVGTNRVGRFSEGYRLPPQLPAGAHRIDAFTKLTNGTRGASLASLELTVLTAATNATPAPTAEPIPKPTIAPEPTATAQATPTNAPAPTLTPAPTATSAPAPTATPVPTPSAPAPPSNGAALAFPGAVGYGASTPGGRGGRVIYVTNLADTGTGTLRAALAASGPRIVLFRVAGTIVLSSTIKVTNPYLTIAGQSAPGEGIQVKGGMVSILTHDVVIRYMRFRIGDENALGAADTDGLSANGDATGSIVVDHSTIIWGPDVGGATWLNGTHDVTVQDSILGEGLKLSRHPEGTVDQGGHSYATNITDLDPAGGYPQRITYYRNLITTSASRNPRVIGAACVDFVNNVVYNWGYKAGYGNPRSLNLVNNWWRSGPETTTSYLWDPDSSADYPSLYAGTVYEAGNVGDGITVARNAPLTVYRNTPACALSVAPTTAADAYARVLASAGALRPVRDAVDQRLVDNVRNRTGHFVNGTGQVGPNPVWTTLVGGSATPDADLDGMPDVWESSMFGSTFRGAAATTGSDFDGDGYTDLDEYLNATDPRR